MTAHHLLACSFVCSFTHSFFRSSVCCAPGMVEVLYLQSHPPGVIHLL